MDFVVAMITRNKDGPFMSTHNPASWGYFDTAASAWNTDILEKQGFPVKLLPSTVRRVFFSQTSVAIVIVFWLKWAEYLAVAGLNLLAQLSDRRSPYGV